MSLTFQVTTDDVCWYRVKVLTSQQEHIGCIELYRPACRQIPQWHQNSQWRLGVETLDEIVEHMRTMVIPPFKSQKEQEAENALQP